MDLKEFLQLVTPDGLRCIAMQTEHGFMQMPAKTVEEAIKQINWIDSKQRNAFFALATFKEEHLNDNGKRRIARKRKNVDKLQALWIDLDYKQCSPSTKEGAIKATAAFLEATGFLPPTAMVSSGNGLHLYWPLQVPLQYGDWKPLADGLKRIAQQAGYPCDHAVIADSARVLRPINTHNWKDAANPKPVVFLGGSGSTYTVAQIEAALGMAGHLDGSSGEGAGELNRLGGTGVGSEDLPDHLRQAIAGRATKSSEFTAGAGRPQNSRAVFKRCGVLRHILKTGGSEQDEPEWNATMMLLAHLDDGHKYVHAMSKGHHDYSPDVTMEKWGQKLEAKDDGSGPTLCATFEMWHEDKCQACPFYQSKKVKTPKSLAYMEDETPSPSHPILVPVAKANSANYPKGWRVSGNNDAIERSTWNEESKQYEWVQVLNQVWEVQKVRRSIQSDAFDMLVVNRHGGSVRKFDLPAMALGSTPDLAKVIAGFGCPVVNANEMKHLRDLMSGWIAELRKANAVEDITGQLGWIIDGENEDRPVIGFATGSTAYYLNGEVREGVVAASGKFKGIVDSFKPTGQLAPWTDAARAIVEQGCDHLVALLSTSFAAPLMRFTDQPGAVVSVVSEDSAAGKSTGLRIAQAVWGNPRHAPATMDDTQTVVKNKLAYLQNLPAYWDEVRGDEQKMHTFIQIAFQVAQGRDRERANSKAETIRAEEWQTLLAACSNESLFDLAAAKAAESNAGIYRIFEIDVPPEQYPKHDSEIMSLVAQLDTHYGQAGQVYAKYLVENFDAIKDDVRSFRLQLERVTDLEGPERFWIAAITAMVLGAKYAGECGLVKINYKKLCKFLVSKLKDLRVRAVGDKIKTSPEELVAAFSQAHQDGKVTVDWFPLAAGRPSRTPILQGSHSGVRKVSHVWAKETNSIMVLKSDFRTWLEKSRHLKLNNKLTRAFEHKLNMIEKKCQLAAGTPFALPRAQCLIFTLPEDQE